MHVVFQEHPDVWLGSSRFRNTSTILQINGVAMLEVGKFADAGYETRFRIYHSDGTPLAKVVGKRLHLTDDGKKANIKLRHEPEKTVAELNGSPLLELRKIGPKAIQGWAELYAPKGVLIKCHLPNLADSVAKEGHLTIGPHLIMDADFRGPIGIDIDTETDSSYLNIEHMRYAGPANEPLPYPSEHSPDNPFWE